MNRQLVRTFFVIFMGSLSISAQAAKLSSGTLTSALEVINLPSENRKILVQGERGEKLYPALVEIAFAETQPMSVRWRALMAAAEARRKEATADLLKAGKHSQWFMRNAALVALTEVNPSEAQHLGKQLMRDKALVVRSAAVSVLAKEASEEIRDLLWEELHQKYNFNKDSSLWIRSQIVAALAERPENHELRLFANLLNDKDQRVQLPAIGGLEKLTGVRLGEGKLQQKVLVSLWKNHLKKENYAF